LFVWQIKIQRVDSLCRIVQMRIIRKTYIYLAFQIDIYILDQVNTHGPAPS